MITEDVSRKREPKHSSGCKLHIWLTLGSDSEHELAAHQVKCTVGTMESQAGCVILHSQK